MLAMAQARIVAEALKAAHPHLEVEPVAVATRGDRAAGRLAGLGGKGLFVSEIEDALRDGRIDLAVHSAKDVPADMPEDLEIAAIGRRADPADVLVSPGGGGLGSLARGATVGTSSPRRAAQLLAIRGDLKIVPLRGNVETRLAKVLGDAADLDATVLAMAGLERSGLADRYEANIRPFDVEAFVPAAGQGALLVEVLSGNVEAGRLASAMEDAPSARAVLAERAVLRELGADCRSCIAVHVAPAAGLWVARGLVARPDGSGEVRLEVQAGTAEVAGRMLARRLLQNGAGQLL